jgi:hypothetical protein
MVDAASKYDDWAGEIEAELERYAKLKHGVRRYPLFAVLTAPLGFFVAPWVALAIFLAWIALWATTLYITTMRTWQYRAELRETRAEALRIREEPRVP